MALDLTPLADAPRLLAETRLRPLQGSRFQPTGFPDLGAATFDDPEGSPCLLLESAQSVANRLETACWDEAAGDWQEPLRGLPLVAVETPEGEPLTNSLLEAHRVNSPYILEASIADRDETVLERLDRELGGNKERPVDLNRLARLLLQIDPNSLLHGLFLAKTELAGGRYRLPRSVSGFIEAHDVKLAASGGVKNDRVDPSSGPKRPAKDGFGNLPFARDEYTGEITAYFNLDLAQIRAYRLGEEAERLLVALALYKIRRFLETGLRLRTACDLEVAGDVEVKRPDGFALPGLAELEDALSGLVREVAATGAFADPPVTRVVWRGSSKRKAKGG